MVLENDFVPFSNSTANIMDLADYDTAAPAGNITGVASSSFANRALRQGTTIAAIVAQILAEQTQVNVVDTYNTSDTTLPIAILQQARCAFGQQSPVTTQYLSGSGTYGLIYYFYCAPFTTQPLANATYTNNGVTYTILSATSLYVVAQSTSAYGSPTTSGTLVKASGTGDSSVTFYGVKSPLYLDLFCLGDGGGGGGAVSASSQSGAGAGGGGGGKVWARIYSPAAAGYAWSVGAGGAKGAAGNNAGSAGSGTTFGASLLAAGGGGGGGGGASESSSLATVTGGAGGTASGGDINIAGEAGLYGLITSGFVMFSGQGGGDGGGSATTRPTTGGSNGQNATANTGGGGGGGASYNNSSDTATGGNGGSGLILIKSCYQ